MPGQYCTGEWVRNKKPYWGEHAYKIHDYDNCSNNVLMDLGPGIHGLPSYQTQIITSNDLYEYYEHVGIIKRFFLFMLGNFVEMWRDIKTVLKNIQ